MRSYRHSTLKLLASTTLCAALAALAACDTAVGGKNDLVAFGFDADKALIPSSFKTAVAKGTRIGVRVYASENDATAVGVIDASSANPAIAEVVSTAGNLITIDATSVGGAEIKVTVAAGDDAFDLTVKDLATVHLAYPGALVPDAPKSLGVQGGTARFATTLKDAAGAVLVGYGSLPIEITPNGAATATSRDVGYTEIAFATTGTVDIQGLGDDKLTMEVIAQADVTTLEWRGLDIPTLKVGDKTVGVLRGVTGEGEKVVGVAALSSVTTNDTSICTIAQAPNLGEGVFTITAVAAGDCQVSATLGALADRATLTVNP